MTPLKSALEMLERLLFAEATSHASERDALQTERRRLSAALEARVPGYELERRVKEAEAVLGCLGVVAVDAGRSHEDAMRAARYSARILPRW